MKKGLMFGTMTMAVLLLVGASCSKTTTTNTNTSTTNKNTAVVNTNKEATNANKATTNANTNTIVSSEITTDKLTYASGDTITVSYNLTGDTNEGAWIGIIPADTVHDSETEADAVDVDYEYLNGSEKGTVTFDAPADAIDYQIRVYSDDSGDATELAASKTFTVTE